MDWLSRSYNRYRRFLASLKTTSRGRFVYLGLQSVPFVIFVLACIPVKSRMDKTPQLSRAFGKVYIVEHTSWYDNIMPAAFFTFFGLVGVILVVVVGCITYDAIVQFAGWLKHGPKPAVEQRKESSPSGYPQDAESV